MEGELWKWTNYWNGWQSRWFILDQGILSYYQSLEEVEQGCKGSLNVSACEISLHPTDPLRLDLAIPGEQHMYVRAKTEKARQQWLVALGSAKACLSNQKRQQQQHHSGPPTSSSAAAAKKAELRLYCDMLMQQVHTIKCSVQQQEDGGGMVNMEQLNEGSYLLSQTCDTFISTLDDLMVLSQGGAGGLGGGGGGIGQGVVTPVQNGVGGVDNRGRKHSSIERTCPSMVTNVGRRRCRTASTDSVISAISNLSTDEYQGYVKKSPPPATSSKDDECGGTNKARSVRTFFEGVKHDEESALDSTSDEELNRYLAVEYSLPFRKLFPNPSYSSASRGVVASHSSINHIPTKQFLDASSDAIHIFDMLDAKVFAPLKVDAVGHIQCLRTKLASNAEQYADLKSIISSEIKEHHASNINSASKALLWLVRTLVFINRFLRRFIEPDFESSSSTESLESCLVTAYEETLMEHHGLVIRSVFAVAMKRAPGRKYFLVSLGLPASHVGDDEQKFFQAKILPELAKYLDSMELCLTVLIEMFKATDIETSS